MKSHKEFIDSGKIKFEILDARNEMPKQEVL